MGGGDLAHALVDLAEEVLVPRQSLLAAVHAVNARRLPVTPCPAASVSAAQPRGELVRQLPGLAAASASCRRLAGPVHPASLPSPSTSCAGIIVRAGRDASASSISLQWLRRGKCAAQRVGVVRRACRRPARSRWFSNRCGLACGPPNAQMSTAMPGKPSSSRSRVDGRRDHAEVLGDHRQRAELGSAARKSSAPGPGASVPLRASCAPSGTAQYATKPRKWSMRARSKSSNVAPEPLDPPAVALGRDGVPVVERVAPELAARPERVRRRAGDDAVAGRAPGACGGRRCPGAT